MKKNFVLLFFTILTAYTMKAQELPILLVTPYNDIISSSYETKIDEIKFNIGVDQYRKKLYISTNDSNFKLKGEPIIGRTLSSFKNKTDIKLMQGWGYSLKIDDYWCAAFRLQDKGSDDSIVVFVYQYKI